MRTTCTKCGQPLDGSHKSYCKACFAEYAKARRNSKPELMERAKEYSRQWREDHPGYVEQYNRERWQKDPEKWAEYYRNWRAENPESRKTTRRKGHLNSLYGISIQDFEAMMHEQSGLCLICNNEMTLGRGGRAAHVDHDHSNGNIRGLLCSRCNNGLGCFDDNPDLMVAAAAYILRYQMIQEEK